MIKIVKLRPYSQQGNFPETDSLGPIGAIITKCWHAKYDSAVDVHNDIEGMKNYCTYALLLTIGSYL
jgi:hypothetical protein